MNYAKKPGMGQYLTDDIVPIRPFLEAKADSMNDALLRLNMKMMDEMTLPNTPAWNRQKGAHACIVLDEPHEGRFLLHPGEDIPDAE